jgi:hypothetical protein
MAYKKSLCAGRPHRTDPHIAVFAYQHMVSTVFACNHNFGGVRKSDTAELAAVLLDANRQQTPLVGLLPLFHAGIQPAHCRVFKVNRVTLIGLGHRTIPSLRWECST